MRGAFLLPVFTTTGAICRLGLFFFVACICAHTSHSNTSGLVVFPTTFLLFFRPLLVSPLFPFSIRPPSCSSLPWVRGQGTLYLAVSALVTLYSRLFIQNWCPDQFDSTWLEGVDAPDSTVKAAGFLCFVLDGGLVCLCPLLPPSNHQAPRTQQPTHDLCIWYHTRTSPDYRIMFSKKIYQYVVHKDLILQSMYVVVPKFLRRQTIATIRDSWMFRPWSIRAVGRGRGDVNL